MLRNLVFAIMLGFCVGLVAAEEKTAPADPGLTDLRADVAADPDRSVILRHGSILSKRGHSALSFISYTRRETGTRGDARAGAAKLVGPGAPRFHAPTPDHREAFRAGGLPGHHPAHPSLTAR